MSVAAIDLDSPPLAAWLWPHGLVNHRPHTPRVRWRGGDLGYDRVTTAGMNVRSVLNTDFIVLI
jgi:hypothetical protein